MEWPAMTMSFTAKDKKCSRETSLEQKSSSDLCSSEPSTPSRRSNNDCVSRPNVVKLKLLAGPALAWTALTLLLNLVWESAHVSLYTISRDAEFSRIATAVLHCTAGDGLIALTSFVLASAVLGEVNWPYRRPAMGAAITVFLAVTFTIYSEWRNVYEIGGWAYLPAMPLVFGIGLTPLLQWLAIPPATTYLLHTISSSRARTTS